MPIGDYNDAWLFGMMDRRTRFSVCRRYRYVLWREWDLSCQSYAMFVGLNPSTADETRDDPTIRRCVNFARSWGLGALCMTNLFAWRATDPRDLRRTEAPIGTDNDAWLLRCERDASVVVAAWGARGDFMGRDNEVKNLLRPMKCLGLTRAAHPRHPLYVRGDTKPLDFETIRAGQD